MADLQVVSLVVPASHLSPETRQHILEATLDLVLQKAQRVKALGSVNLSARLLAGNDFGLTPQGWAETVTRTPGTANTYEDSAINAVIARDRYVGVYGVHIASSWDSISGVRIAVGAQRTHQWDFQAGLSDQESSPRRSVLDRTFYIMPYKGRVHPVLVPPNTRILVQHYVRGGTALGVQPAELVFLGVVVEPLGGGGAELQVGVDV